MLLVVLLTTSSGSFGAPDTLRIVPQNTVNVCAQPGDRKFVIYVDLGEIYASDSLMSFDIYLKYDTTKIVFTDMLTTGTLSAQMSDLGPVWRPKDPGGIMYAGGASIIRNAKGALPLIAFQGLFRGGCEASTTISLDDAQFNEEFKRQYTASNAGSIVPVVRPTLTNDIASTFSSKRYSIKGKDSIVALPLSVITAGVIGKQIRVLLQASHHGDFSFVDVVSPSGDTTLQVESLINADSVSTASVLLQSSSIEQSAVLRMRSNTSKNAASALVTARMQIVDSCACRRPANTDSMSTCTVVNDQPVSVQEMVVDEGIVWLTNEHGDIIIQSLHGQPESVDLYTVLGSQIQYVPQVTGPTTVISADQLPREPLIIRVVVNGTVNLKMVMK